MSDNPPFSQEERAMMKYYAEEIAKISVSQDINLRSSEKMRSDSAGKSALATGRQEMGSHELSLQRQWEDHGWGWWKVGKRQF
jgi:hypothetical protein